MVKKRKNSTNRCVGVCSLGTIQRTLASTFFEKPPTSNWDEAISFFKKVEDIINDPKNSKYHDLKIRNKTQLGDCYTAKGDYKEAKKW
jgi:hypothetical protein